MDEGEQNKAETPPVRHRPRLGRKPRCAHACAGRRGGEVHRCGRTGVEELDARLEVHRGGSGGHVNCSRDQVQSCCAVPGPERRGAERDRDVIRPLDEGSIAPGRAVVHVVDLMGGVDVRRSSQTGQTFVCAM